MKDSVSLKWISSQFKGFRLAYAFLIFICVLKGLTTVFMALAVKWIINVAEGTIDGSIYAYAALLVGTAVFEVLTQMLMRFLKAKIFYGVEVKLKNRLFRDILGKDYAKISAYHSGDILNRLYSDTTVVANNATYIVPNIVLMLTRLIGAVGIMAFLSPLFTGALIVVGLIVFLVASLFRKKLKFMHKRVQESDGKSRSYMQECVENRLAVKVFNAENVVSEKSSILTKDYFHKKVINEFFGIVASSCFNLFFSVGYVAALIWGAFKISAGAMDYGTLSAVLQLVSQVQVPIMNLSGILPGYYSMIASAERLIEIQNLPNACNLPPIQDLDGFYGNFTGAYFNGVSFSYGRDAVIENATFDIKKGEFAVIKGISGIGKSTILKLMLGVYPCGSGNISYISGGKPYSPDEVRGLFAYVPQGNMLFSGTVRENVCFVKPNATDEEIAVALKTSIADEFIKELPDGLETVVGENGYGLSEGQIQRIAVARALLTDAPILLLDEATSALDSATEEKMLANIRKLGNKTIALVTHKTAATSVADKIIEIIDKRVVVNERIS